MDTLSPTSEWMGRHIYADDAIVILLAATVLTYMYWSTIFSKGPLTELFFSIPQATDEFVAARQQKAEERCLDYVFKHHVWIPLQVVYDGAN